MYSEAVIVTTDANANGTAGIHSQPRTPPRAASDMQTANAIAASSWLAIPNRGKKVLMPPSGSVTPKIRIAPQPATITAVQAQEPSRHEVSRNLGTMLPRDSWSWKRATRVPASTAVRMNSASNMIAKWYQNEVSPELVSCCMMWARPNARVGAPPVREMIDSSPTAWAVEVSMSGVRLTPISPRPLTNAAAVSGVPPVTAAEEFIAK